VPFLRNTVYSHFVQRYFAIYSFILKNVVEIFRRFATSRKMADTKGCYRCCVVTNPHDSQYHTYLCAETPASILLMQWYDPLNKFMLRKVSDFQCFATIIHTCWVTDIFYRQKYLHFSTVTVQFSFYSKLMSNLKALVRVHISAKWSNSNITVTTTTTSTKRKGGREK